MVEEPIEIRTGDGTSDGFLVQPDGSGPRPGVIHLTDLAGIRPSHRAMARRLAEQGYTVLLPNVFYRTGRPPLFDFAPTFGEERTMKRFAELAAPLTPEAVERDGAAYVDFLTAHPAVAGAAVGIVGYCFTGAMALRTAAARPGAVAAIASFHGGGLFTDGPSSPHRVLPRVAARLYFGHAIEDRSMPASAIEKLDRALEEWGGRFASEVYAEAHHGWTVEDAPAYHAAAAERAFARLTALLAEALPRHAG
jgi:carboxymethylenebutenolidase